MALQLANVKQILTLLVDGGKLKAEDRDATLAGIKSGELKGFAGEIVVAKNLVTKADVDAALLKQAGDKAQAALSDINSIAQGGRQEIPEWLKVNLGNNGVNAAPKQPSLMDGASAAANIAQNIVILANRAPKEMVVELKLAVESASALALYFSGTQAEKVPLATLQQWQADASEGLRKIANHFEMSDTYRGAITHMSPSRKIPMGPEVVAYLEQRNAEMTAAAQLSSPWQSIVTGESKTPSAGGPVIH